MSGNPRHLVAISVGDSPGRGPDVLDAVTMRIATALLELGADLAYGGHLRDDSFTSNMLEVARSQATPTAGTTARVRARMVNYQSWPFHEDITDEVVADTLGLCRFVKVDPPGEEGIATPGGNLDSPRQSWRISAALTRMRELMVAGATAIDGEPVPGIAARIVVGGKVEGWAGIMPGVVEEAVLTLQRNIPVYVLGGFGGAAALLAEAMDGDGAYPEELTLAHHERLGGPVVRVLAGAEQLAARAQVEKAYADARATLQRGFGDNGLTVDDNRDLARSEDLETINRLLEGGLRHVLGLRRSASPACPLR